MLHDLWHYGNAGASPLPENHVTVGIEPYGHDYESAPAQERMTSSLNHELAHIVTTDKATASDRFFRSLFFGKVTPDAAAPLSMLYGYLTTPRWYAPRWYLEGIAVYLETWMDGGVGRAIGPYDEMVFRTLVRTAPESTTSSGWNQKERRSTSRWGATPISTAPGSSAISPCATATTACWRGSTGPRGSRRYFASQFRHVFGRSLEDEWTRWIEWERDWQQANLSSVRRHPTTGSRPLSDRALGAVSRAYYDSASRSLVLAVRYPGQVGHLVAIDVDSGSLRNLREVMGASGLYVTALAFDPASRTLFYTTNNANWRHLVSLHLATGRAETLIRDARIGDLAFNPRDSSLWGIRHDNGFSTLVRIPPPYHEWHQVRTLPYGRDLFDLDIAPDGSTLVGSMSDVSGSERLVRMDIAGLVAGTDTSSFADLFDFGNWSPSNFVFSPDGRYLYGSSYYSGVSNIFRYDFTTSEMEPLSNAETGFFKPVPLAGRPDSLVVFRYIGPRIRALADREPGGGLGQRDSLPGQRDRREPSRGAVVDGAARIARRRRLPHHPRAAPIARCDRSSWTTRTRSWRDTRMRTAAPRRPAACA